MSCRLELANLIGRSFDDIASIMCTDDGVRVTTHCMYPSNGLVQVTVRGGVETVVVSDEGGAMGEALSAGIPFKEHSRTLAPLIKDQGLSMKDGTIFTPQIPIAAACIGILHVANASQEVARWLYEHVKIKRTRDFKAMLAEFLDLTFYDRVSHNEIIFGNSNKPHKFANVVSLPNGRRLIIDPAVHDQSSINARIVANLDIRATRNHLLEQRIVYDDEEAWTPADLNLLQVGATVIPFSRSSEAIRRIAAGA
jgi:hypothetical protein